MTPKILLRISSLLMLFHTIGHSIGALSWKDAPPSAAVARTIEEMQNNSFVFMGRQSTIAGFYVGYGMSMIAVLLLLTILLWLLSIQLVKRFVLTLGLFLLVLGILEYIYFFPLAAAFSFLAGLCALIAVYRVEKH